MARQTKKRIKTKESHQMDFIFYEGVLMSVAKIKRSKNKEIAPYTPGMKAPDCVFETIVQRMDELNKEINEYESILIKLKGEYAAHANFILNGPFGQRDLSQSSENKD